MGIMHEGNIGAEECPTTGVDMTDPRQSITEMDGREFRQIRALIPCSWTDAILITGD